MSANGNTKGYRIVPYSHLRRALSVMMDSVRRKHIIHTLIDVDVTLARQRLRALEAATGESLSFTSFIAVCLARAVTENRYLHACHKGRNHLILFDDVDIATAVEREVAGHKQPITYIIRAANTKSLREIHHEIRAAQVGEVGKTWEGFERMSWTRFLPRSAFRLLWRVFWWARETFPQVQKRYGGTVGISAVGMFGKGAGWGIPLSYHTLDVTLGGIAEKPGVVDGRIAIREYLSVTLSVDHDIVDGVPAARFATRLRELIESGYALMERTEAPAYS